MSVSVNECACACVCMVCVCVWCVCVCMVCVLYGVGVGVCGVGVWVCVVLCVACVAHQFGDCMYIIVICGCWFYLTLLIKKSNLEKPMIKQGCNKIASFVFYCLCVCVCVCVCVCFVFFIGSEVALTLNYPNENNLSRRTVSSRFAALA